MVVPNLWGGIVAAPGWLKSPVIQAVTKPLTMIDDLWRTEHESGVANFRAEKEEQELREDAWKQLYTAAVKKGSEPPIRPDDPLAEPTETTHHARLDTREAT